MKGLTSENCKAGQLQSRWRAFFVWTPSLQSAKQEEARTQRQKKGGRRKREGGEKTEEEDEFTTEEERMEMKGQRSVGREKED